jgi:hypothetical protein
MNAFETTSFGVAEKFLQTVLVVDNMAAFGPTDLPAVELDEPDEFDSSNESETLAEPLVGGARSFDALDAGTISSAFASKGLVCGILKPVATDSQEDAIVTAAKGADIVVLDWQMEDEGELATSIIQRVVNEDEAAGGRLRLIAIYTGQSPLSDVSNQLHIKYAELTRTGELSFSLGSARVIFLAKDVAHNAPAENVAAVTEDKLPDRLIEEFANFAGGLLPNATLAAIAGLRRHTHRMLARFDKSLDGPFLSHRTLLPASFEAEEYAADLIMAELDAQVPIDAIVSEYLNEQSVRDYLEHKIKGGASLELMLDGNANTVEVLDLDRACALIEKGLKGLEADIDAMAKKVGVKDKDVGSFGKNLKAALHERLYRLLGDTLVDGKEAHSNFAVRAKLCRDISSVKVDQADTWPVIRLGTLLASANKFWVCLTPMCDTTRLPTAGDRLLLAELVEDEKRFEFIVRDGDQIRRLNIERKRTNLASFKFVPNATGHIKATIDAGQAVFDSVDDTPPGASALRFRWLGDLKAMHAQRLVQAFTSNLSRVGVDDFEWHRVQMPGG